MKMSIRARGAVLVLCALAVCAHAREQPRDGVAATPTQRKLLGSQGEGTPVLDWILERQSGGESSTPVLDWFLNLGSTQNSALFGPTSFAQRFTNRVATFFFSELLRFNMTETVERIDAGGKRASLELTTTESEFARALFDRTSVPGEVFGVDALNATRFVEDDVCGSDFLRGGLNDTMLDDAYWQASGFTSADIPRSGCYHGCILGSGTYEAIARTYGIRRTFAYDSWRGKCFDEMDPSSVTNLIKLNYGLLVEGIFPRLREPIELYPGRAEVSSSQFQPEGSAIVVDYSSFEHDFQFFRDELRPIYPGVYVGKMYAMPGMSMFGGALQVPIGASPVFTVNFLLVGDANVLTS